jgi:phosphoglycolate phosphatase-like HAD superfamily hydrolase
MKRWIVVDLDGTLCDCSHRVHWAQAKEWDKFHAGIPEDKPYAAVVSIVQAAFQAGHRLLLCTGRNEANRKATIEWLNHQTLWGYFDDLIMRPEDCRDTDADLKVRLVDEYFGDRAVALEEVLLVLDDRDRVVQAFRDAGFKCWQVAAGDY